MASPPRSLTTRLARLAAVAPGTPLATVDVDVVHGRDADNVSRLETLADLKRDSTGATDRLTFAVLEETHRRRGNR